MIVKRTFLFLQGVCTPFFARLADRLRADGHRVFKINFTVGDRAYWGLRPAWSFRGDVAELPAFLVEKYQAFGITDQILFGDRRPIHRPAVDLGDARGIRTHVFEEGYFRPYWVTLEREGVNGHSLLPRDPDWFREVGARLPDYGDGQPFNSPFWKRAVHDVAYHSAGALNPLFFNGYKTHAQYLAPLEYAGYARRFTALRYWAPRDRKRVAELLQSEEPYFVLPLQLSSDAQIRDHSRFEDMAAVIEFVMASFAHHAPANARLVIKNHPLDMGLVNHRRIIKGLATRFSLADRVTYLKSGDLESLLRQACGVVTVNSTVGSLALGLGRPTVALSDPIYNLPGLTFQGSLDDFWQNGLSPDRELFRRFRNVVIQTTQVNGGFYSSSGIALAVENSCRRLELDQSPLDLLLAG